MTVSSAPYLKLVEDAFLGKIKLPAFQRNWVWTSKQTSNLFDSIRLDFPIGAFLFSAGNLPVDLGPKPFQFSKSDARTSNTDFLVLDGQQRITAGVQLFYASSSDQGDTIHFFLDLNKIKRLYKQYCETNKLKYDEFEDVTNFSKTIDADDGYIVAKKASKNPRRYLVDNDWLFIPLLIPENSKKYDNDLEYYLENRPEEKLFIRNVISEFKISNTPSIPYISLDSDLTGELISRIFSTLNTSGKMLTPFELVVAILFPHGVDLREEIENGKDSYNGFYPRMDKTGEIALQTAVLLTGEDPKKSKLPRTLTPTIWKARKEEAFSLLEQVGGFLTDKMGFALDKTNEIIPYDSFFAPLAVIFSRINYSSFGIKDRNEAERKLKRWIAASVFSNRYQEGVHNKQKSDSEKISNWILNNTDEPDWISETFVPALTRVDPKGAIGKFIFCIINKQAASDVLTDTNLRVGDGNTQYHHVFPTKFVGKLPDWNHQEDSSDRALNIILLSEETNKSFLNDDPALQIAMCIKETGYQKRFEKQFIGKNALEILSKGEKSASDFRSFLKLREGEIATFVKNEFGIPFGGEIQTLDE